MSAQWLTISGVVAAMMLVGGFAWAMKKWGKREEQMDQKDKILKSVTAKKEIVDEVNAMDDDKLLDAWLGSVRKHD